MCVVRGGPQREGREQQQKRKQPSCKCSQVQAVNIQYMPKNTLSGSSYYIIIYNIYRSAEICFLLEIARESKQVANEKKNRNDRESSTPDPLHEITI